MFLHSNDSAIKRFTYDWLIRFAELHPFLPYDGIALHGVFKSHRSKYAAISPLFTTVIVRHMPNLLYVNHISLQNGLSLPNSKRCSIYIGIRWTFTKLTPGMITWLKNARVFFYGESLEISISPVESSLTPDELKYLLQSSNNFGQSVTIYATLTEPITFSEVWPQVTRSKEVVLHIDNLHYDENFVATLRKNGKYGVPGSIHFYGADVTDEAILKVVDYLIALPLRHRDYQFQFKQPKPVSLAEAIYNKYVSAGCPIGFYRMARGPFYMIGIFETDGKVCSQYTHAHDII